MQTVKFLSLDNNGDLAWINIGTVDIGDGDLTPAKMSLEDGRIILGNASNQGAAVAISGDVTINNTGTATIVPSAITTAKIADGTIVDADINDSATIAGTKIDPDFGDKDVKTEGNVSGANITATGDVTVGKEKGLKLSDADGSHYVTLQAPNNVQVDTSLTLPASAGSDGQVLQTNGSGTLSWASAAVDTSLATVNQTLTASRTININ